MYAHMYTYTHVTTLMTPLLKALLLPPLHPTPSLLRVNPDGLTVSHIRTGQPLAVDVYHLGVFLLLTMADFAEQLYSWQDVMFGNTDGRLRLEGCPAPQPAVLWPGDMRPGLWVSAGVCYLLLFMC